MDRKIEIDFYQFGIKFYATLLEKEEEELCNTFWKIIEKPVKMYCRHPLSTGQVFAGEGRPPKHVANVGTQATPIGKKQRLLCDLKPGMIGYAGGCGIHIAYGTHITEPLPVRGSVIANVDKEYMSNLVKAGELVWNAQYITHNLVNLIVRRKEK